MSENTAAPGTEDASTPGKIYSSNRPTGGPAPTAPAPEAAVSIGGRALTTEQIHAWMDGEVSAGRQTREQADAALAADGVPAKAAPSDFVAHLFGLGFAPARADQFTLPPMVGPNEPFDKQAHAADKLARSWLSGLGLSREIGNSLAAEISRTSAANEKMSQGEFDLWEQGQRAMLERLWGADTNKKIALAQKMIAELEAQSPGFIRMLRLSGAGSNAMVIAQLAMHAERLDLRPETKKVNR